LSVQTVADWLNGLGLIEYAQIFEDNEIGMADLAGLSTSNLTEMGITKIGPRNRMLKAIADLAAVVESDRLKQAMDVEAFPSLLAVPLYEYMNEKNPVMKLWHACDAVELLLRLIVMLGISELKEKDLLSDKLLLALKPRIEEPTLGKWKGMAIAVTDALPCGSSLFPELKPLVDERLIPFLDGEGDNKKGSSSSFSALRNQLAHGGGMTKAAATQLLGIWRGRIEQLFNGLSWLQKVSFIAKENGGLIMLTGPNVSNHATCQVGNRHIQASLEGLLEKRDTVVVLRGDKLLSLWPLGLFGLPRSMNADDSQAKQPVSQVYVRRGDVRLQYTPIGSDEVCQSESEESALEAFEQFFFIQDKRHELKQYEVRSFNQEIERDASRLIGREKEIALVQRALRDGGHPLLWLSGPPGMGKSYLMARVASDLLTDPPQHSLVLAYRFKAGDDRCNRDRFIRFVLERLLGDEQAGFLKLHNQLQPIAQLKSALELQSKDKRVILILDGMDEIAEGDSEFTRDVVVSLAGAGSTWLCAGREECGLPEIMAQARAHVLFDNGLPAMDHNDVRNMLLEKIGPLRKKLILQDKEDDDGCIMNPFVQQVVDNAKGFPIYVTYVIGDILANRYCHLDGKEKLPPSLDKYHEELLKRCSVGVLHQVVSPLAATIAIAKEPLTVAALGLILHHNNSIPDEENPQRLVNRGISAIASMLRRSSTPENHEGFTLFHHSLRQHMLKSEETKGILSTAEKNLAKMVSEISEAGPAQSYLLRWGISHLLNVKHPSWQIALNRLLLDAEIIRNKLACQPLESFLFDYVQAFKTDNLEVSEDALQVISGLALDKLSANEWSLEQVHSLLIYHKDQTFYRAFLEYISKLVFPENKQLQTIVYGYKARLANLLRREGGSGLASAELLLRECVGKFEASSENNSMLELSRLQYDLGYIGFLRGNVDDAIVWFSKSVVSSEKGGSQVSANISEIVSAHMQFSYGYINEDEFSQIINLTKPSFIASADEGNETAKRWIMNVHGHLFSASYTKGELEKARVYFNLLENDPWFIRFDREEDLLPYKAKMAMLNDQPDTAVQYFEKYFVDSPRLKQEAISSTYLDYGAALLQAGKPEEVLHIWDTGLKAHDDFGNRPWKQKIEVRKKALMPLA